MSLRGMWQLIGTLSLLVIALGSWILWLEKKPAPEEATLADLDPQSIQTIVIERSNGTMTFTRRAESWFMRQPFQAPADPYHMEQVTGLPRQISHARYQIEKSKLAQFELSPPRVSVKLNDTQFRFGMQNPIDFRRYVQVDDNLVHLTDDTLMPLLDAPATSWIDTKLLPSSAIRELELPDWHVMLTEKGAWTSKPSADNTVLREWVNAWRDARAIRITPFEQEIPADAPVIKVRLMDSTIEFIVLQQEPELIMLRPDLKLRYHFYGHTGRRLLAPGGKAEDSS